MDKKEKDLFEIPRVNLFYKQSNVSKITAKIFLEEFADLCRKEDFGRIALKKNVDEMQEFETLDNHHHLGGTRIGDNPNTSVVDKNLKVHFIKNLFVSGSSTFFTGAH